MCWLHCIDESGPNGEPIIVELSIQVYNRHYIICNGTKMKVKGLIVLPLLIGLFVFAAQSAVVYATPIPAGCPGSNPVVKSPTAKQLAVCAKIPAGCPGSTKTLGPNDQVPDTCPYTVEYVAVADPALNGKGDGNGLFTKIINPFIAFLSAAVGIVVVLSIVYSAIQYSSAGGDAQKIAVARGRIQKSIMALLAYLVLWAFLQWVIPGGIG